MKSMVFVVFFGGVCAALTLSGCASVPVSDMLMKYQFTSTHVIDTNNHDYDIYITGLDLSSLNDKQDKIEIQFYVRVAGSIDENNRVIPEDIQFAFPVADACLTDDAGAQYRLSNSTSALSVAYTLHIGPQAEAIRGPETLVFYVPRKAHVKYFCMKDLEPVELDLLDGYARKHLGRVVFDAAEKGDMDIVSAYVRDGGDVNARDERGRTILIRAMRSREAGITKLLLSAKTDVNAKDENGKTALMQAVIYFKLDMAQLLIDAGADVNAKDRSGATALQRATEGQYAALIEILKKAGAK